MRRKLLRLRGTSNRHPVERLLKSGFDLARILRRKLVAQSSAVVVPNKNTRGRRNFPCGGTRVVSDARSENFGPVEGGD
jgi:hypothetical protein